MVVKSGQPLRQEHLPVHRAEIKVQTPQRRFASSRRHHTQTVRPIWIFWELVSKFLACNVPEGYEMRPVWASWIKHGVERL